jgi:deoxyribonuclease V
MSGTRGGGRFAAVDVHYPAAGGARAACVVAADLRFSDIVAEHVVPLAEVAPYRPGEFYARELPALRAVLAHAGQLDLLVVDGYVDLDPAGRPGLGAHAHAEFDVAVVGVAKTAFRGAVHAVPVCRGQATHPLYVTAVGLPRTEAAELVKRMAGRYRLPDALRRVDALARGRGAVAPSVPASSRKSHS